VQLALNVEKLDEAIDYYSRLFGTPPNKIENGYANFAVADPPLKLVLFEGGDPRKINHLGVEVESSDEVRATQSRIENEGLRTESEDGVTCCFAVQDKFWTSAPDGQRWEIYTVLEDAPGAVGACACT
jgi:lactoylglutathione lyase